MRWRASFLAALLLFPSSGRTALVEHYDLASLVHMSTYVVLVERGAKRTLSRWHAATKCRVKKVYKGAMTPGQEIEVLAALDETYGQQGLSMPATPRFSWEREMVLFLVEIVDRTRLPAGAPALTTVAVRTLAEGKVYRFVQIENPGGDGAVPQGRDPEDVWLSRDVKPVDYATFEEDLLNARARAARFESLLAAPRDTARTEALLGLLGPPRIPSAVDLMTPDWFTAADAIARETYGAFLAEGAVESALDAYGRCRIRLGMWSLRQGASAAAAATIARSPTQPLARRMAAIWVLMDSLRCPEALELRSLLEDPAPEIRTAAACLLGTEIQKRKSNPQLVAEGEFTAYLEALAACWNREKDRGVRAAILCGVAGIESAERYFNALKYTKNPAPLDPAYVVADIQALAPGRLYEARIVYGAVAGDRLRFRNWTLVIATKGGEEVRRHALGGERLEFAPYAVADREAVERRADARGRQAIAALFDRTGAFWGSTGAWGFEQMQARFPALLVPPLPPGAYEFSVEVTVEPGQPVVLRSGGTIITVVAESGDSR